MMNQALFDLFAPHIEPFSSSDFGGLKNVDRVGLLPGTPGASSGACAG